MKRRLVKAVAVVLVVITLLSVQLPMAYAAAYENDMPIVYIYGNGRKVYNEAGEQVYPVDGNLVGSILKESDKLIPGLLLGATGGGWDTYCDALVTAVKRVYAKGVLTEDGEAPEGQYPVENTVKVKYEKFALGDYKFQYDNRLDPCEVAHQLRAYIEEVIKVTGKDKIQLVSRCLGCNYAAAYLQLYGDDLVQSAVFYVPAVKGVSFVYEGFTGELKFDSGYIDTYTNTEDGVSAEMANLFGSIITVTNQLGMLSLGTGFVQSVYDEIRDIIIPELILATYGTMPGLWSCVDDEHYEKAKKLVFEGKEETYAGLIEKIDYYHYNVYNNFDKTLTKLEKGGMKVCVIAKYNVQLLPFFEESDLQSDGDATVPKLSFGATAGKLNETFDREYIIKSQLLGTDKYISKDNMVDASTCLFPDYTWFIKNQIHGDFSSSVNKIIYEFLRTDEQLTVWNSKKGFTQFMDYDKESDTLTPITTSTPTGGTGEDTDDKPTNLLDVVLNLLKIILQILEKITAK